MAGKTKHVSLLIFYSFYVLFGVCHLSKVLRVIDKGALDRQKKILWEWWHLILNFSTPSDFAMGHGVRAGDAASILLPPVTQYEGRMAQFAKHGSFSIALLSLFGGFALVVLRQRFHVVQQLTTWCVESSLPNTTFTTPITGWNYTKSL